VNVLLTELLLLVLPGGVIVGATWPRFGEAVPGLACAVLLTLPLAFVCAWSQNANLRSKAGWVKYSGGMLSTIANSNIHSVPLESCRWYDGSSTRATTPLPEGYPVTGAPAILIEFPYECQIEGRNLRGKLVPTGPLIVAVGFDEESRQAWQELLDESEALHDLEREKMPSPLSSSIALLLAFLYVYFGFFPFFETDNKFVVNLVTCAVTLLLITLVALHFRFLLRDPQAESAESS